MILLSAAINGSGSGILWVAQGKYVADCVTDENKGFFYGYFWAALQMSNVIGNLIAAFVIGYTNFHTFYLIMSCLVLAGTLSFLMLKKPIRPLQFVEEVQEDG